MAFSEAIKTKVKEMAHFKCCICQNLFVQVHHIIPQKDDGSDDIDNAAPLCASCHDRYGDNKVKRKSIKQMRDFWYKRCEKREMSPDYSSFALKIDDLYNCFQKVENNQDIQTNLLHEITSSFSDYYHNQAENIHHSGSLQELVTLSGIASTGDTVSAVQGAEIKIHQCNNCGSYTFDEDAKFCSKCGKLY